MAAGSSTPTKQDLEDLQEEERLEAALEHLKVLHLQLRDLRTAIPRLIDPLATKQPSPEALLFSFQKSVSGTRKELTDFKTAMTSEESKKIFSKADESRRAHPKGIRPWRAVDHPDWTTLP